MLRLLRILWLIGPSLVTSCGSGDTSVARQQTSGTASAPAAVSNRPAPRDDVGAAVRRTDVRSTEGFRSRTDLDEHFRKHGSEFGRISREEYLLKAQALRDAPVGGSIEEIRRDDGTVSRFDRSTGAFIAFNHNGTIRTFFKPNDGEAYFRRQASRVH